MLTLIFIYFDHRFAAIDRKVAKRIFDRCVSRQGLSNEKSRVLLTHQIDFLVEADKTIVVTNGYIDEVHFEQ